MADNKGTLCARMARLGVLLAGCTAAAQVLAFAVAVTPPRVELAAKPGETVRQVIEISNMERGAQSLHFKTMDWSLTPAGGVVAQDALTAASCRPWFRLERPDVSLGGGAKVRYRTEVHVPADAPDQECRAMVSIEGADATTKNLPMAGRLGIIYYVRVGHAAASLTLERAEVRLLQGQRVPGLWFRNAGTASGRLQGYLTVVDSKGVQIEASMSTFPILPGEHRWMFLQLEKEGAQWSRLAWPLHVKGTLFAGKQQWKVDEWVKNG